MFTVTPKLSRQITPHYASYGSMLSVIIRTHNGENVLLDVLRPLVSAAAEGIVRDVCFFDMGSTDGTETIADAAGATMVKAPEDTVRHTRTALEAAHRADWVMLLDQTTVLAPGWLQEAISFVERQERLKSRKGMMSAVFRPEHEPEAGSADMLRRASVLLSNRLFSRARLSQGIIVRRADLMRDAGSRLDWKAGDPGLRLPGLLRLRSRTHLAQPIDYGSDAPQSAAKSSQLSRAAL